MHKQHIPEYAIYNIVKTLRMSDISASVHVHFCVYVLYVCMCVLSSVEVLERKLCVIDKMHKVRLPSTV